MSTEKVVYGGGLWYTCAVDHTNDVFWWVLAVGAFVLGVAWALINRK